MLYEIRADFQGCSSQRGHSRILYHIVSRCVEKVEPSCSPGSYRLDSVQRGEQAKRTRTFRMEYL